MSERPGRAKSMADLIVELRDRQARARSMGGARGITRQHERGRLTVRERIDLLLDRESWFEVGALALPQYRGERDIPCDAVVTGFGTMSGRKVAVLGIDATVAAGSTAQTSMRKQGRLIRQSQRYRVPVVLLCDADGGRMPDVSGWRFSALPLDFGSYLRAPAGEPVVPRVAAVLGPCYGDSALHAATAHFVVMLSRASLALSGPSVVESAIGEVISDNQLAGPAVATACGNAHMVVNDEQDALSLIGAFLSYLPSSSRENPPTAEARAPGRTPSDLETIVPLASNTAYDMYDVIDCLADEDSVLPWAHDWGSSILCVLARLEGRPVGIVASQPRVRAGALDSSAMRKQVKFVDMCDTFNLPLIFLHDVPGLMIGSEAERSGILQDFENVCVRIAQAHVPKISVVIRKAYGGGHFAMGGRPVRPDFVFAWPSAELGFMAPEAGVKTVFRSRLENVLSNEGEAVHDELLNELLRDWEDDSKPWDAAGALAIDDVIEPGRTRSVLATALDLACPAGHDRDQHA